MINSKVEKAKQILSKPSEKRSLGQLNFLGQFLYQTFALESLEISKFIGFYMGSCAGQYNLSKALDEQSTVFLIEGTMTVQNRLNNENSQVQRNNIATITNNSRIVLQQGGFVGTISPIHMKNCELLAAENSLDREMLFLQQNSYFSKMGTITCLTFLYNCQVKRFSKGQKFNGLNSLHDNVMFIRQGELSVNEQNTVDGCPGVRTSHQLISIPSGEFFGYFTLKNGHFEIVCKSAYCTLFEFSKHFFNIYVQIMCGQQLKAFQNNLISYIEGYRRKSDKVRKGKMQFLTQTNFNKRKSLMNMAEEEKMPVLPMLMTMEVTPNRERGMPQNKSLSSRQMLKKNPPFEELTELEFRRMKCQTYQRLSKETKSTRNEVFYSFFKNNWQTTYTKRKQSLQRTPRN